jgi:DNA-binding transcriptional regulator YdaS (Cro superfamily)
MPRKTGGAVLLAQFLEQREIPQSRCAAALGVSSPTVHDWLKAVKRPRTALRVAIDRWTGGAVPSSSWATAKELATLDGIEPWKRTGSEG